MSPVPLEVVLLPAPLEVMLPPAPLKVMLPPAPLEVMPPPAPLEVMPPALLISQAAERSPEVWFLLHVASSEVKKQLG